MANTDNPHGFFPCGHMFGVQEEVEPLSKVVGYGTAIFKYDVVHRVGDGSIEAAGTNFTPGTTAMSGVALNHGAASTATSHFVVVDPFCVFEAQDNNDTDGIAAADLGLNINLEANAGDANSKVSGHELDESTANTTSTLDLHLRRLFPISGNAHGSFARIEVISNRHRQHSLIAGV